VYKAEFIYALFILRQITPQITPRAEKEHVLFNRVQLCIRLHVLNYTLCRRGNIIYRRERNTCDLPEIIIVNFFIIITVH